MKKRLHGKKAGVAILLSLIILSLAEVIFRIVALRDIMLTTSNFGEQLATIIFATTILIFAAKGKDRVCYICYGGWLGYFVLDQLFELPGTIATHIAWVASQGKMSVSDITIILRILSMITILVIGALLVEYMNDKTIYNRAFNFFCIITLLMIVANIAFDLYNFFALGYTEALLAVFNNVTRVTIVFMFTFFAYDSAKHQLSKTDFSK